MKVALVFAVAWAAVMISVMIYFARSAPRMAPNVQAIHGDQFRL